MTRSRTSRSPKKQPPRSLNKWLGWALKLGIVGLVLLGGLAIYLDAIVQEKFSGKRWTIPAKVYARPLELFVGQKLSRDDFLIELDALGYRRESVANGPGAAAVNGNTVDLNTRGFQFYEGTDAAQQVRVRFAGDSVADLSSGNGAKLAVARLEPLLIGGLYPKNLEDRILIKLD
ncbi:penicillin-binding protein 1B, partial [Pseudomonas syringae pv. actinidiae]|nr:penicillin-binding protein 1B [Pseudomonas syringae pv. actinidiae]